MLRIALIYGGIAGAIIISAIIFSLSVTDVDTGPGGYIFGYSVMLVALTMIFFGIRTYRNKHMGGVISFTKAFLVGLTISLVATVIYVFIWEIYLAMTDYAFTDAYITAAIEAKKAAGLSAEQMQLFMEQMEKTRQMMKNPLLRMLITSTEILPVALLVTLVSSGILRKSSILPE
ncbi:MAG: DUF4199 domain-containing protein [bacterium]